MNNEILNELNVLADTMLKGEKSEAIQEEAKPEEIVENPPMEEDNDIKDDTTKQDTDEDIKEEAESTEDEDTEKAKKSDADGDNKHGDEQIVKSCDGEDCDKDEIAELKKQVASLKKQLDDMEKSKAVDEDEKEDITKSEKPKCDCAEGETCEECKDEKEEKVEKACDGEDCDKKDNDEAEDEEEVSKSDTDTVELALDENIVKSFGTCVDSLNAILYDSQTKYNAINKSISDINKRLDDYTSLTKSMDSLVAQLGSVDTLQKSANSHNEKTSIIFANSLKAILESNRRMLEDNAAMRKSMQDDLNGKFEKMEKALSDISTIIVDMQNTQEEASHQPARVRKSFGGVTVERNFNASRGDTATNEMPLTKSQISSIMADEIIKGSTVISTEHLTAFETGATLPKAIMDLVMKRANAINN